MALLKVRHLNVKYGQKAGWRSKSVIHAVRDVSFEVSVGEIVGVVGESGSGKSTLARSIMQLIDVHSGQIDFLNQPVLELGRQQIRQLRRCLQMVFQDPVSSLDPRMRIGRIVEQPLQQFYPQLTARQRNQKVLDALRQVALVDNVMQRYPHQLSGGQCQRVSIARAMITCPDLVICDEAVSALDVSVQAQILNLLRSLTTASKMSMLFISHDMRVIRQLCDRVLVMYQGRLVESADCDDLFERPKHAYTRKLLASVPEVIAVKALR